VDFKATVLNPALTTLKGMYLEEIFQLKLKLLTCHILSCLAFLNALTNNTQMSFLWAPKLPFTVQKHS